MKNASISKINLRIVSIPNFSVVRPLLVCFDTLSSLYEYLMIIFELTDEIVPILTGLECNTS